MLTCFLHIRDGSGLILDEEGAEFPDIAAACAEAQESACELAIEQTKGGPLADGAAVELTDTDGNILLTVPLRMFLTRH